MAGGSLGTALRGSQGPTSEDRGFGSSRVHHWVMASDRSDRVLAEISVEERRSTLAEFFALHPGTGPDSWTVPDPGTVPTNSAEMAGSGLGRAVIEFQEWEISSGRIGDRNGSDWWATVNGQLVADLIEASDELQGLDASGPEPGSRPDPRPSVAAWVTYALAGPGDSQRALWDAHELSINDGAALAEALLVDEPPAEQEFARIVLRVVKRAASDCVPTDDGNLGMLASVLYPSTYPTDADGVARVREGLSALAGERGMK